MATMYRRKSSASLSTVLDKPGIYVKRKVEKEFLNQATNTMIAKLVNQNIPVIEYFKNIFSKFLSNYKFATLMNLAAQVNLGLSIKVSGGGISAHMHCVIAQLALALLDIMNDDNTSAEYKEILAEHVSLLKICSKSDLRVVERKKTGCVKARKMKPTNKR